jgi:hypothetical protein
MQLSGSHTYAASIDDVLTMLGDSGATKAKYESMGHRDIDVIDCTRLNGTLHVESTRTVDVDLPGFAKKVLKPTNTMHQNDEWHEVGDGSWEGVFGVEVAGAPIELSGVMRLVAGDGTCTHDVTITMNVKVPLIGGKIADWAGKNDVKRTLDAEFAFGDEWLSSHPG